MDPDVIKFANPTFYVHKSQIDMYCSQSGQNPELGKPLFYFSDYRKQLDEDDDQPEWMATVSKSVLEFLSNIETENLHAKVPDEMLI